MRFLRLRPERFDRGETLIEALVTIAILGIAVVALLGAIMMGIRTSVLHRKHAQAQAELRSWAERISATGATYVPCAKPGDVVGPGALPQGLSGSVIGVEYWDGTSSFGPGCAVATDHGLQRVTLRITAAPGVQPTVSEELDVVVRKS